MHRFVFSLPFLLFLTVKFVTGSIGDRSYVHRKCLKNCSSTVCDKIIEDAFQNQLPFANRLLGWTCFEECQHDCMWSTVDAFVNDGMPIPQFHGKVRLCCKKKYYSMKKDMLFIMHIVSFIYK